MACLNGSASAFAHDVTLNGSGVTLRVDQAQETSRMCDLRQLAQGNTPTAADRTLAVHDSSS